VLPFFLIAQQTTRIILASLFLFAGSVHLTDPTLFLPIMPPFIPFPFFAIIVSGLFELLGGVGLLVAKGPTLALVGWGLTLLLLAVFPANIYMAVYHIQVHGIPSHAWMAWARLPLQALFILAVLWVTGIWPKANQSLRNGS